MNNELIKIKLLLIISFILVLITNSYFTFDQSLIFGARDGADYYLIAKSFTNLPVDTMEYHRAWRFIIPTFVGIVAKITNIDVYDIFRFFVILFSMTTIIVFISLLEKIQTQNFHIYFLSSFLIFNPYLFRFFIAMPTMINDLVFINAGILIIYGFFTKNKIFLFLGFLLALFTRQNSIFFVLGIIIVKFFFKDKSLLKLNNIIPLIFLTIVFFYINNNFANNYTDYNDSYALINRMGIFNLNYSYTEFINYHLFPLIIIFPVLIYFFYEKEILKIDKSKSEVLILIIIFVLSIVIVAYLGGPIITGKNFIRLINLGFPLIILLLTFSIKLKVCRVKSKKFICYQILFFIWSLHPTFSNINLFSFFKF
tara:strand:+ start:171 stop:1274 length:1104 start_codon:yes stop_codon:yes gene_type:complete